MQYALPPPPRETNGDQVCKTIKLITPQVSQARMCTKINVNKDIFYRRLSFFFSFGVLVGIQAHASGEYCVRLPRNSQVRSCMTNIQPRIPTRSPKENKKQKRQATVENIFIKSYFCSHFSLGNL